MKITLKISTLFLMFIILISFSACQLKQKEPGVITINEILRNPSNYVGKKVIIYGDFNGFETDDKLKPSPESLGVLWVLKDKTGYIYAGGYTGGLNPYEENDIGTPVRVEAVLRERDKFFYLEIIETGALK